MSSLIFEKMIPAAVAVIAAIAMTASVAHAADEKVKAPSASTSWSAEAGLGYDSNVYRTHSGSYTDFAPLIAVPVTPKVQSGFFVPLEVKGKYLSSTALGTHLAASGRVHGRIYANSALSKGNDYNYAARIGLNNLFARQGKRTDELYAGLLVGRHQKAYVDRDNGGDKLTTVNQADISNRYNYNTLGIEARFSKEIGAIQYGLEGVIENRDHDDPVVVDQYDHRYSEFGGNVEFKLAQTSQLKLSYAHTVRDYAERNARDLNGTYANANGLLKYTDNNLKLSSRNQLGQDWVGYLDYAYTQRADNFQGYADYTENEFGVRVIYAPGEQWRTHFAASRQKRNYANAYAYDEPTQPRLTADGSKVKIKSEYMRSPRHSLWTELEYDIWNTNDLRFDYGRYQIMAGMKWDY